MTLFNGKQKSFLADCTPAFAVAAQGIGKFTKQSAKQIPAFAAVVEQSHHNTDSYITRVKSRRSPTAGRDAQPSEV